MEIYLVRPKGVQTLQQPHYSLNISTRESGSKARNVKGNMGGKSKGSPDWSIVSTDEND